MTTQPFSIKQIVEQTRMNSEKNEELIGCDRETGLFEFRVIMLSTGRQTGNSNRIEAAFNPITDLYVTRDQLLVDMFADRFAQPIHYLNLNSRKLDDFIRKLVSLRLKTIYIDLGANMFFTSRNLVHHLIRTYDEQAEKLGFKPVFVIT
jgi:hypothetical protein